MSARVLVGQADRALPNLPTDIVIKILNVTRELRREDEEARQHRFAMCMLELKEHRREALNIHNFLYQQPTSEHVDRFWAPVLKLLPWASDGFWKTRASYPLFRKMSMMAIRSFLRAHALRKHPTDIDWHLHVYDAHRWGYETVEDSYEQYGSM
jgi:hypothetical protein